MEKIMIVEDDGVIAQMLRGHLEKWGYQVVCVTDFADVLSFFTAERPKLVLMDISLPYYDGYYWCREIRKVSRVPVIFVSSRTDNMDLVMAVQMGGDDYVTKPFDLQVLAAKVQAMLRRAYDYRDQMDAAAFQGVVLDLGEAAVLYKGKKVSLTKNEFRILHQLFQAGGHIVSRDRIMKSLWDDACFIDDNTLTVNVTRLRHKLEEIGIKNLIVTKKGLGYCVQEGWTDED